MALTAWYPGSADLGTVNEAVNVPADVVVIVDGTVATWPALKDTLTVSLAPKPAPFTVTLVVGGPTLGLRVIPVVRAATGCAKMPRARIAVTARAVSARADPARRRGCRRVRAEDDDGRARKHTRSVSDMPPSPKRELVVNQAARWLAQLTDRSTRRYRMGVFGSIDRTAAVSAGPADYVT